MSDLKTPDTAPPGKSSSTPSIGLCLPIDFPMHANLETCASAALTTFQPSMSSPPASPAKTSASPAAAKAIAPPEACKANAAGCSGKSYESSKRYNLAGWSLRTSLTCSLSTIAATLRQSSGPLRTAGMWDFGECLMLNISESPSNVAAYSWSPVIDACPPSSSWLTPRQWTQYLQRLNRSAGHGPRMPGLPILYWQTIAGSQITMGCTTLVAEPHGWDQMVERQRTAENDELCLGLDAANLAEAFGAGNAVVTQVAEWVGRGLIHTE